MKILKILFVIIFTSVIFYAGFDTGKAAGVSTTAAFNGVGLMGFEQIDTNMSKAENLPKELIAETREMQSIMLQGLFDRNMMLIANENQLWSSLPLNLVPGDKSFTELTCGFKDYRKGNPSKELVISQQELLKLLDGLCGK